MLSDDWSAIDHDRQTANNRAGDQSKPRGHERGLESNLLTFLQFEVGNVRTLFKTGAIYVQITALSNACSHRVRRAHQKYKITNNIDITTKKEWNYFDSKMIVNVGI